MTLVSLFLIAVGLSMDAFAASVSNALCDSRLHRSRILAMASVFGLFQALMPLAGFYLGLSFLPVVEAADHWIAFALLSIVGLHMMLPAIRHRLHGGNHCRRNECTLQSILIQGIATSIDAFAVGVGLATLDIRIFPTVIFIGITTFLFSLAGVWLGRKFHRRLNEYAEITGGLLLVGIGIKILLDGIL